MFIEEIQYADGELIVKLKPVFEALRQIKNIEQFERVNEKVRTLETRIISNKKASEEANLLSGASDGIRTHAYRNHNPRS